jgi:predicted RNA polymerase sigma factor
MKNEPAFPGLHPSKECHYQDSGMRLRDYFAAKAMQGILFEGLDEIETAKNAYAMADAMLKARQE